MLSAGVTVAQEASGVRVARRHLAFAEFVTRSGARIALDLDTIGGAIEKNGCKLPRSTADALPPAGLQLAKAYASDYCKPWLKLWNSVLDLCDGDNPPAWCNDEAAVLERLDLDGYFSVMVAGIQATSSELERDNLMDIVLATFHAHVINDFGQEPPDRWASRATVAYLASATPAGAIALARGLQRTWVGISPGAAAAFGDYLKRVDGISGEQRDELQALVSERFEPKSTGAHRQRGG